MREIAKYIKYLLDLLVENLYLKQNNESKEFKIFVN